ncbi:MULTISPECIES: hypothetical protein [Streptomyces]|uniref:hypothetical protein n=1 Tax=Streptomyces TaxID=1883 RepID=UPI0004CAC2F1
MASVKAEQAHSKSVTTLVRLRRDRILNEVFATGDALKLMRLLGITAQTAMPYGGAACPERTAKLPI